MTLTEHHPRVRCHQPSCVLYPTALSGLLAARGPFHSSGPQTWPRGSDPAGFSGEPTCLAAPGRRQSQVCGMEDGSPWPRAGP